MPEEYIQVQTTVPNLSEARKISSVLVEQRLAACVQIVGPITSTYWWKGKIETAEEWFCIAKTRRALYGEVEAAIKAAHAYEVPEIIATPIVEGRSDYLRWIGQSTSKM